MQLAMPHRTIKDCANGCNKNVAQVVEDDGLKKKETKEKRVGAPNPRLSNECGEGRRDFTPKMRKKNICK